MLGVLIVPVVLALAQRISRGGVGPRPAARSGSTCHANAPAANHQISRRRGNWTIVDDGGKRVLGVDGRSWLRGQPAGSLAEKARAIYGSRNEEFIDNVKAWAYFPYAVATDIPDFHDGEISIRFKIVAGQLDQCAGICST